MKTAIAINTCRQPLRLGKVIDALADQSTLLSEMIISEDGEDPETARVPKTMVQLDDKDAIQTLRLVEKLEALEDVQKVYFNAEFSDDVLASYTS